MGSYFDIFKKTVFEPSTWFKMRPKIQIESKVKNNPVIVMSDIDILINRINKYKEKCDFIEKRLCEPDSVLYGLTMHTTEFAILHSISKCIYYNINNITAYDSVKSNLFFVELDLYFSVSNKKLYIPFSDWLDDLLIILNHYLKKDGLKQSEQLVLHDIKSILDAVDILITD